MTTVPSDGCSPYFWALSLNLNFLAWKVFVFPIEPRKGADVHVPPLEATTTD
jgi:hypothetical protein